MIISVFPFGERASYCLPLPNIIRHIKAGTYKEVVAKARQYYRQIEGRQLREALQHVPSFSPAGHFKSALRSESLVSYSGCVLLETDCLPDDLLAEVRQVAENDPFTLACFQNALGDRLEILVRTGGSIENYRTTFYQLVDYYEANLPVALNTDHDYPYRLCSMSHDPLAYYNPGASSFEAMLVNTPTMPPVLRERRAKKGQLPTRQSSFQSIPSAKMPVANFN